MAVINKRLATGTLSDTEATLYTAPSEAGAITIIKSLILCNTSASVVTITVKLAGIEVISGKSLAANETLVYSTLDQIIQASELIEGLASADAVINYYLSGKEII